MGKEQQRKLNKQFWPWHYFSGKSVKFGDSFKPLSPELAQEKIDDFFKSYPAIKQWSDKCRDKSSVIHVNFGSKNKDTSHE